MTTNTDRSAPPAAPRILLVEDEQDLAELLAAGLERRGFRVEAETSGEVGLRRLQSEDFDVILTDIQLEGIDGLSFAERAVENWSTPVIVLTAHGNVDNAIEAIRAGVYDFLKKPIAIDSLVIAVERAVRHRELTEALARLRSADGRDPAGSLGIIGESKEIRELRTLIRRVAPVSVSTLVTGESGTGKELVARALHSASGRADEPFVAINCAALPDQLLESELFGHVQGAFTDARDEKTGLFVEAGEGTIFLDEIGELPQAMQSKLLRALQEEKVRPVGGSAEVPVKARIVAATNQDLEQEIEEGNFREDLYYRLNVITLEVPPLRSRGNDILLLAQHFIDRFADKLGREVRGLSQPAAERLLRYDWPGNVRELSNCMERATVLTQFDQITVEDLPDSLQRRNRRSSSSDDSTDSPTDDDLSLEELERRHIERVLAKMDNNKSAAARILGIDRRTLHRKIKRYGLEQHKGD